MRQCIVGVSFGMTRNDLAVFVNTARKHWKDDIVIVGDDLPDDAKRFLLDKGVTWLGGHEKPAPFFRGRWKLYIPVLQRYDLALISDLRDVVFQATPKLESGLHVTEEDAPIWREGYNTEWVKGHGQDVFDAIKDYPILCAGTVWGDANSLIHLCSVITDTEGMDQGTLNVFARLNRLDRVFVHPNEETVWTLGLYGYDWESRNMPILEFDVPYGKHIATPSGRISPIVHQYDRHPNLQHLFRSLYL